MEKGRWVTLGSRGRGRRQRRKKTSSQQTEQCESSSSKLQKSKQSANTPPPMAFPPRERKVSGKPKVVTKEENEISKILNKALEDSAKRALEPMPTQVDPSPTHRSPMAVKTRDYPKKSFWTEGKTQDSKNSKDKGVTEQVSSGSTDVSDSSSQHSEVNNNHSTTNKKKMTTPEKIKIKWIFEQKPTTSGKGEGSTITSGPTTPNGKLEKNWPKMKKAASMPNLNPNAPCFQVNPYARSFKSFTPRPPSTVSWQPMSHQGMMTPWRSEFPVFNSYSCLPTRQIHHNNGIRNGIRNDNRDSVSNLLLPYSCAPY